MCFSLKHLANDPGKLWHEDLIYNLSRNSTCGNLLQSFLSFADKRKQQVLLYDQCSLWGFINAGVPQGSILGTGLFYLYKRPNQNSSIKPKAFCRRHFSV